MSRPISQQEAAIVQWLLDHPGPKEPTGPWSCSATELVVVGGCDCGCCSIDFRPEQDSVRPIRDAIAVLTDGRQSGLILWGTDSTIHSLEVYDLDPNASHELPGVSGLRTWEQRGDIPSAQ